MSHSILQLKSVSLVLANNSNRTIACVFIDEEIECRWKVLYCCWLIAN